MCVPRDGWFCSRVVFGGAGEDFTRGGRELRARESPLPSPWEAHRNEEGALYFYNRETGESVWTLPDELLARETPHRVRS